MTIVNSNILIIFRYIEKLQFVGDGNYISTLDQFESYLVALSM